MDSSWWFIFFGITAIIFSVVLERVGQKAKQSNLRRARRLFRDSIIFAMIAILAFVGSIVMAFVEG